MNTQSDRLLLSRKLQTFERVALLKSMKKNMIFNRLIFQKVRHLYENSIRQVFKELFHTSMKC